MSAVPWASILSNGGRVFIGGGACVPFALVNDLLTNSKGIYDVELCHIHTLGEIPWIYPKYPGQFRTNTFFMSRNIREAVETGVADYTPSPTSDIPRLFDLKILPLDVALIQVTPPDERGMVSLGLSADVICSAITNAKVVVAQINRKMPVTFGDTSIPFSSIDHFIEHDAEPETATERAINDRHRQAARYAAQLIEDGSVIQASLGNSPQAVLGALLERKHLGIHTGCFTDPMMDLIKVGAVDNSTKEFQKGLSVASHVLGSSALYDFVNRNPEIAIHRSEWTNDSNRIRSQRKMVAINGAREVDLTGQVVRDSRGHRFYGGIGATQDFIRGASMSEGGCPIIVLTATDDLEKNSRIVSGLTPGSGVCTSRSDVHYVVTEYGVANLVGQSIRHRVLRLVEIAHPKFREELLAGARMQGWIPKIFAISPTNLSSPSHPVEVETVYFDDQRFSVRPLHPSDLRAVQEFFYAQNEEAIRMRYGYPRPVLGEEDAYRAASVDQSKDLAIGVFRRDGFRESLQAVGSLYQDPGGETAEVSFLVHEAMQRKGIASFLLNEIAVVAEERGIAKLWASVLPQNTAMARLFERRGATRRREEEGDSLEFWMETAGLVAMAPSKESKKLAENGREYPLEEGSKG